MTTPRTELDTRFSEPGAQPTSWVVTLEAIKQAELFWISTVRVDGRPHVTPLVAVWLDDALHFSAGPDEQKARNLAANPNVALTTGANGWQGGLDVVIEGEAARVTGVQQLERLAAAWSQKWDGRWQYEVDQDGFRQEGGPVLVFAVRPAKVLAFTKGGFSHTRHRFRGADPIRDSSSLVSARARNSTRAAPLFATSTRRWRTTSDSGSPLGHTRAAATPPDEVAAVWRARGRAPGARPREVSRPREESAKLMSWSNIVSSQPKRRARSASA